jgi:hypothetical protein
VVSRAHPSGAEPQGVPSAAWKEPPWPARTVTDEGIHQQVVNELKWEAEVEAREIGVAVREGLVTFAGWVDHFCKKCAAERGSGEPTDLDVAAAAAFEIQTSGPASLHLVDGAADLHVADLVNDAQILVDGSLVEVFDGAAAPYTTRAYSTATSQWMLRTAGPGAIQAWRLGLPQNG